MRSKSDRPPGPVRSLVTGMIAAPWLLALVWPMALIVLGAIAWERFGAARAAQEFVALDPKQITVTTPPEFIRTDITQSVFDDFGMQSISLLDVNATAKIASAYSTNAWVSDVTSVRKLPGGKVDVRLRYREIVAMVKVFKPQTDGPSSSRVPYFFPVDRNGVLLPAQDFSGAQTVDYIHIDVPGVYSTAPSGSLFGEPRVEAAASLAALLHPYRGRAGIVSITSFGDGRRLVTPQFEVHLNSGETLFWGSPPGREPAGEADAASKLQWMLSPGRGQSDDLRWAGRSSRVR